MIDKVVKLIGIRCLDFSLPFKLSWLQVAAIVVEDEFLVVFEGVFLKHVS